MEIRQFLAPRTVAAAIMVLAGSLLVHGCVAWTGVEPTNLTKIKSGTSQVQVEEVLGEPLQTIENDYGAAAVYLYNLGMEPLNVDERAWGYVLLSPPLWPVFEYEARKLKEQQESFLTILYDRQANVSSVFQGDQVQTLRKASAGDPDASYYLSLVEMQDSLHSWKWMCLAAHKGNWNARKSLAHDYRWGWSPSGADQQKAYLWYRLAEQEKPLPQRYEFSATGSHVPTGTDLDTLKEQMSPKEIAEAERLVAEWEPNQAECGTKTSREQQQDEI